MSILVINAGSSSLKFDIFKEGSFQTLASGLVDWAADTENASVIIEFEDGHRESLTAAVPDYRTAVSTALSAMKEKGIITVPLASFIKAVGHRVVHGGDKFCESVLIDNSVKTAIRRLIGLAPLHNQPALDAIESIQEHLPDIPHVAVFDTAFYANMPLKSCVYPLPYEWYADWGIRRFGFHGISHGYSYVRTVELMGRDSSNLKVISCHLGNGCSATATCNGTAIATTMGFTPADGLMMGTRPGSVDPGILTYVQHRRGLSVDDIDHAINHGSGLLGISGISHDFRKVEEAALCGHERAMLALDIYTDKVRSAIGALAVTMGGTDALVFTAGVGENSPYIRDSICRGLECIGLLIDKSKNLECVPDVDISAKDSTARIFVVRAREGLIIAQEAHRVSSALYKSVP